MDQWSNYHIKANLKSLTKCIIFHLCINIQIINLGSYSINGSVYLNLATSAYPISACIIGCKVCA